MNDKVKQEFERAWAKSAQFADFTTQRTGIYFLATEQAAWEGFQLGRASLAREVPQELVEAWGEEWAFRSRIHVCGSVASYIANRAASWALSQRGKV